MVLGDEDLKDKLGLVFLSLFVRPSLSSSSFGLAGVGVFFWRGRNELKLVSYAAVVVHHIPDCLPLHTKETTVFISIGPTFMSGKNPHCNNV